MNAGRVLRVLARTLAAIVLVASGTYILVYLWRWEWQRAIVSGVFFLAALVVVSTLVVLRRAFELDRLSRSQFFAHIEEARSRLRERRSGVRSSGRAFGPRLFLHRAVAGRAAVVRGRGRG